MTNNNHPMLPTQEQLTEWDSERFDEGENFDAMMIKAFQAGADLELEACIEWLGESPVIWHGDPEEHPGSYLREARLPKLKSQAEEALDLIDRIEYNAMTKNSGNEKAWDLEELESVRRALKRLQELEKHDD
jgi:hypothetical protein